MLNSRLLFLLGIQNSILGLVSDYHQVSVIIASSFKEIIVSFHHMYVIYTAQNAMPNKRTYIDIFTHRLNEMMHIMI
jgi:hypothetical protein